ncbi:MAG TPA: P-II family nitrogen regulator [Firmicutes bacterium]|nr:P-II family nitrogen regulator [Bacillota bacterium]
MKALFLVLNKTDKLDKVLKTLLNCGVRGATILNSTGMGRRLAHEVPIFASLGLMLDDGRSYNYTVFVVMKDEKVEPVINALAEVLGGLDKPDTGIIFTVPVDRVVGLAEEPPG